MKDWQKYAGKIEALNGFLEKAIGSLDVEYELKLPGDEGFDPSFKVPYLLFRYHLDQERAYERKVELFEYYLEAPIEETTKLITDMVEEFLMEIEQNEYGGG